MEDNKYYIPTINEFYVGFEYEVLDKEFWIKKDDFSNSYDYEDSCFYGLLKDLDKGNIRVKYLDKEDIESLGFNNYKEPMGEYDHTWSYGNSKEPKLKVWFNNPIPVVRVYNSFPSIAFQGIVKNKSELKKLMQQLNIK